jgi:hypothetical protein
VGAEQLLHLSSNQKRNTSAFLSHGLLLALQLSVETPRDNIFQFSVQTDSRIDERLKIISAKGCGML